MSSKNGTVYLLREDGGVEADGWLSPEPAEGVIRERIVAASDIDADEVEDLSAYVDPDAVASVVGDGDTEQITFTVEGRDVVVESDGSVAVDAE